MSLFKTTQSCTPPGVSFYAFSMFRHPWDLPQNAQIQKAKGAETLL